MYTKYTLQRLTVCLRRLTECFDFYTSPNMNTRKAREAVALQNVADKHEGNEEQPGRKNGG